MSAEIGGGAVALDRPNRGRWGIMRAWSGLIADLSDRAPGSPLRDGRRGRSRWLAAVVRSGGLARVKIQDGPLGAPRERVSRQRTANPRHSTSSSWAGGNDRVWVAR